MYQFFCNRALCLIFYFYFAATAFSQQSLLHFAPGARASGMGRDGVIGSVDPTALYWNPAALGVLNSNQAYFAVHDSYSLNYGGYAHCFPFYGTLAASVARTGPSPSDIDIASMGWGKALTRSLYLGVSLSSYMVDTESWTGGGVGVLLKPVWNSDAKLLHHLNDRLTLAAAIQNIPFVVSDHDHQVRLGIAFSAGESGPQLVYSHHIQREDDTSHLGFSFPLFSRIAFYAGVVDADINRFGLGLEIPWDNFQISTAYDSDRKRLVLSTSFRIGRSAVDKSEQHYQKARQALQNRDKRLALQEAKKTLAYADQHHEAAEMVASLTKLVKFEDQQIDSLLRLARLLEKRNWYISAAAQYLKVLRMDANNRTAERAITTIRPHVNIHTEKWYQLGVTHYERGDLRQAKEIFESILLVRDDHLGSRVYLDKILEIFAEEAEDHYYTGLGFYSQRNLHRAEEEFQQALELKPNYPDAIEYLNRIREEKVHNSGRIQTLLDKAQENRRMQAWVSARNNYRQVLEIDPLNSTARQGLVSMEEQIDHHVSRLFESGERAFQQGDLSVAADLFHRILAAQPSHAKARDYMTRINSQTSGRSRYLLEQAELHIKQSQWERALAYVDSAKAQQPNLREAQVLQDRILAAMSVEKLFNRASQDYYSGNYLMAIEKLNQVLEKEPQNLPAIELREQCQSRLNELVDSYFNRGIQLFSEEKYRSAINEWDKALEINPYHKGSQEYRNRAVERLDALKQLP